MWLKIAELLAGAILGVVMSDAAQQSLFSGLRKKLQGEQPEKIALRNAINASFLAFNEKYPEFTQSLFDQVFITKPVVVNELAKLLVPHEKPDQQLLETAWREQFGINPSVSLSTPLVFFINTLEKEVIAQPLLGTNITSQRVVIQMLHDLRDRIDYSRIERPINPYIYFSKREHHSYSLENLANDIPKIFVNQEEIIKSVSSVLQGAFSTPSSRPRASLLTAGPPGTGKTYLVEVLTKLIFGTEKALIKFQMRNYDEATFRHEITTVSSQ